LTLRPDLVIGVLNFKLVFNKSESIWTDPGTSARLKKRIVRTLIEEVLAGQL